MTSHVLWIDTTSLEEQHASSHRNTGEPQSILKVRTQVQGMNYDDIGVITPYKAQKFLLKNKLKDAGYGKAVVDTVDGFQGSEKELILYSGVRSNQSQYMGVTPYVFPTSSTVITGFP